MKVTVVERDGDIDLDCECLLLATGWIANVEDLGLEEAGVDYELGKGVVVNDLAQSVSNENVYALGDCVAGDPRPPPHAYEWRNGKARCTERSV
jgi:pyruvate/2-oxoglutarate dehydrogenase complex dihydrolipoamide dehydrogenase (E3) component